MDREQKVLWAALLSLAAICFGELFEQVVFVPNWLLGEIDRNVEHFHRFKHAADPGMFYFPMTIISVASHLWLLGKGSTLSSSQKGRVRASLVLLLVVLVSTGLVIAWINGPAFDRFELRGDELRARLWCWAVINLFRILLPFWGVSKLMSLLSLESKPAANGASRGA